MKINWKVRFKNKVFLAGFAGLIVRFVFDFMGMFDIAPAISESVIMQLVDIILIVLTAAGVVVDPTTSGMSDSQRALNYTEPAK